MSVIPAKTEALFAYAELAGEWTFALAHMGIVALGALIFNMGVEISVGSGFSNSLTANRFFSVKKKFCEVLTCKILIINVIIHK